VHQLVNKYYFGNIKMHGTNVKKKFCFPSPIHRTYIGADRQYASLFYWAKCKNHSFFVTLYIYLCKTCHYYAPWIMTLFKWECTLIHLWNVHPHYGWHSRKSHYM